MEKNIKRMKRAEIMNEFYGSINEDARLEKSRQGQMEYFVTMNYIHKFLKPGDRVLEIGAGTGRYSVALAKEGYKVSSVELVAGNLNKLREKARGLDNIDAHQGDALDLGRFGDDSFDVTLSFGPMYHLYEPEDHRLGEDEDNDQGFPGRAHLEKDEEASDDPADHHGCGRLITIQDGYKP